MATRSRGRHSARRRVDARALGPAIVVFPLLVATAILALAVGPQAFGYETVVVRGASMGDAAPVGSLVIGSPKAPSDVLIGDVILLQSDAGEAVQPLLHRVAAIRYVDGHVLIQTKGDANAEPDPQMHVLYGPTVTLVVAIPNVGYVLGFAQTPTGWALMIAMPMAVIVGLVSSRRRTTPAGTAWGFPEVAHGGAAS